MRGSSVTGVVMATAIALCWSAPRTAAAAVDQREMRAREAFAMGRYQDALDLFAKLYAEKLHPNYLRNIGRCYQNLGDPDQAINSFTEYLRKAKAITAEERQEVDGYIQEMEDLKRKRAAASTTAPPPHTEPATEPGTTALPVAKPVAQVTPTPAGADLTQPAAGTSAASDDGRALYQRWWFWAIVGGVAAAGLGVAAAAGIFTKTEDAKCPAGISC